MRILTVRQPWAWAIIHGGKTVENRVRNLAGDYRGPVLIHAAIGKTAVLDERQERLLLAADDDGRGGIGDWLDGEPIAGGIILGVVDLVGVHLADDCVDSGELCSPWAEADSLDTVHMVLANPRALDEPIPYTGALGLRKTDFGIEGDWLVEYHEPCKSPCAGVYGCPPSCHMEPVARLVATP